MGTRDSASAAGVALAFLALPIFACGTAEEGGPPAFMRCHQPEQQACWEAGTALDPDADWNEDAVEDWRQFCGDQGGTYAEATCPDGAVGRCLLERSEIQARYFYPGFGGYDYDDPSALQALTTTCTDALSGSFERLSE